jgi:hypothetical protein
MNNSEQNNCSSCDNWLSTEGASGECRSHAPQTVVVQVGDTTNFETLFPKTIASDWCGEFEQVG